MIKEKNEAIIPKRILKFNITSSRIKQYKHREMEELSLILIANINRISRINEG